jgi:hypothetical protein
MCASILPGTAGAFAAATMDDPLLTVASGFPFALVLAGGGFIWWSLRTRFPADADVQSDVLEALSEREALPLRIICRRASLDPATTASALEHLRQTGRAVRWYDRHAEQQELVYRKVA